MITLENIAEKREIFYESKPMPLEAPLAEMTLVPIPQEKFMTELDPKGHKILSPEWYPNIWKQTVVTADNLAKFPNNKVGDIVNSEKKVERVSIAMQQIMLQKHLTHVCGNKTNFDIMELTPTQAQKDFFVKYKQKWTLYNYNTAIYEFCKSIFATGDAAFCIYKDENKNTSYRVFSILNQEYLHPVFDYTGRLRLFGRTYTLDDIGTQNKTVQFMEVWDDQYYYLFSQDDTVTDTTLTIPQWDETNKYSISEFATDDKDISTTWYPVLKQLHGNKTIPIIYCKHKFGACWTVVQPLIDSLERALSQFFENNKTYAFRIMYIQGGFEIQGEFRDNGKEPSIVLLDDANSKVGMVEPADASKSFQEQLDQTMNMIKMCGFIVTPPQSISGDTSGTAIKILYSPAIEKAINDIHFLTPFITQITDKFKESVSTEDDLSPSDANTVHIRGYLTPYIPQNDQETVSNLATATWLSDETKREKDPNAVPQETMRVQEQTEQELQDQRNAMAGASTPTDTGSQTEPPKNNNRAGMNADNIQKQILGDNKNNNK